LYFPTPDDKICHEHNVVVETFSETSHFPCKTRDKAKTFIIKLKQQDKTKRGLKTETLPGHRY